MSTRISTESYTHLLSPEYWEFIHQVEASFPIDFSSLPIEKQREAYNAMLAGLASGDPQNITVRDSELKTAKHNLPIRTYQANDINPAAHIVYFHGGGFVLGDLDSHGGICADLCAGTGFKFTSVDYRLAPEHLYPAALEDALLAYEAIAAAETLPLMVMGDSAGGCLAAYVAHHTRNSANKPMAQVLIYPALGSDYSLISYERYADAPLLTTASMYDYLRLWLGTQEIPKQLAELPLADKDFRGLPKTIIFSAEFDPIIGDAELYCAQVRTAGGEAHWQEEKGLTHGYLHGRHQLASAQASFARIQAALQGLVA